MQQFFGLPPVHFVTLTLANVDNDKLSDKDFREFMRNNLHIVEKIKLESIVNEEVKEKAAKYYNRKEDSEVFQAMGKQSSYSESLRTGHIPYSEYPTEHAPYSSSEW